MLRGHRCSALPATDTGAYGVGAISPSCGVRAEVEASAVRSARSVSAPASSECCAELVPVAVASSTASAGQHMTRVLSLQPCHGRQSLAVGSARFVEDESTLRVNWV